MFCSQPAERMRDLGHGSRRGRVAGRVRRPGHSCSKIDRQFFLECAGSPGALVLSSLCGGEARTCIRREAGRGTLRGEGFWAVGQQRVEVRHVRVLHHWHIVGLEAPRQKSSEKFSDILSRLELQHILTLSVSTQTPAPSRDEASKNQGESSHQSMVKRIPFILIVTKYQSKPS